MGQRLNIEIYSGDEVLANSYYHWSGYTSSALNLTNTIIENFEKIQEENKVLRAIRLLETTGARLTIEEINYANSKGIKKTFEPAKSRNDGLIAISNKGIENTRLWEEARVKIDIENKTVDLDIFTYYTHEHYAENYGEEELKELMDWNYSANSFANLIFDEIKPLYDYIKNSIEEKKYAFKLNDEDNLIVSFIE